MANVEAEVAGGFKRTKLNYTQAQRMASRMEESDYLSERDIEFEDSSDNDIIHYEPPPYDLSKNYYSMFWVSYLENEKILNQIQEVASENMKTLNAICNLEDFYDGSLIPKMLAFPQQYIARITYNMNKMLSRERKGQDPANIISNSGAAAEADANAAASGKDQEEEYQASPEKTPLKDTNTIASTPDVQTKKAKKRNSDNSTVPADGTTVSARKSKTERKKDKRM